MRYRKLRIAWSVFWGLAAVLLIVLWVRSYSISDGLCFKDLNSRSLHITSLRGQLAFIELPISRMPPNCTWWLGYSKEIEGLHLSGMPVVLPHGLFVLLIATLAVAPWIRWRFSLRTLLITTTLIAVVLGIVMYLAH